MMEIALLKALLIISIGLSALTDLSGQFILDLL